ncbi:MFS general substrate transporter [Exidia glandulosa HHB12029]|uniref:MFS general substrate transporter n=1 Tax=Exidia glandulosa HHB12029 TaxID=1314781 RepID=A0A165HB54_EXIGL|nr:MFS general substrate transporter [Exidia glandulosa HHB12029]
MSTVQNEKEQAPAVDPQYLPAEEQIHGEPPKFGYRHPLFQVLLVSFICFTCPGMYNALSGLGGGGQIDATTADRGGMALNSTFAVMAFFGGSFVNKFGPRLSLTLGTIGYTLYVGSLLSYNINGDGKFNIGAGAILGVCAGILWTAQGVLMLAYSTEATKGRYIAVFWAIFNLGAVIGAAIPLGQNIHQTIDRAVPNTTYIAFIVLTAVGSGITLLLARPTTVRRTDGTLAVVPVSQSWQTEILNVLRTLVTDPAVLLLFPFFAASNLFYTWQFNAYNLALFNPRTRYLNNMLYWLAQIVGAGLMGLFLDSTGLARKKRAIGGWFILFAIIMAVWGGNYAVQKNYTRATIDAKTYVKEDFTQKAFGGHVVLYILNGITDACWQTYAYWVIGAMSNNARKIAVLVGMYKGIQSGTAAVGWHFDGVKAPYMNILGGTWGLLAGGLVIALPMIWIRVKDHTDVEDDTLGGLDAEGHKVDALPHHHQQPTATASVSSQEK